MTRFWAQNLDTSVEAAGTSARATTAVMQNVQSTHQLLHPRQRTRLLRLKQSKGKDRGCRRDCHVLFPADGVGDRRSCKPLARLEVPQMLPVLRIHSNQVPIIITYEHDTTRR